MRRNFTTTLSYEGRQYHAVILPQQRSNGLHYEVNIDGFARFFVKWGASDRYELWRAEGSRPPEGLILAVSDAIEAQAS